MKIYKTELEDGLASAIEANTSIAYVTQVEKHIFPDSSVAADLEKEIYKILGNFDLEIFYPTKSILASTSWNRNDDVFGTLETWRARKTPIHTFTDIDHDHDQLVGHITNTWAITTEGKLIPDDTKEEDLPTKFHLCDAAVIYKMPRGRSQAAIQRAENLIASIEENKKFVSMECVFPGFDYAVISAENKHSVVARNEETAFLTKHLRIYGGTGEYNGYKIGRFLKNMVFSGKGYVDKPANPESIIFDKDVQFNFAQSDYQEKWFDVSDKIIIPVAITHKTENDSMANEELQKQIDDLKTQNADLQTKLADANVKKLQDEVVELKATLATKVSEVETVTQKLADEAVASVKAVEEAKAAVKENTELKEKLAKAELDKVTSQRVSKLVEGGIAREDAEAKVNKFVNLNDEQFDEVASAIISAVKPEAEGDGATAGDLGAALDGVTPNAGEGTGSVEDDDTDQVAEVAALRLSLGALLSSKFATATVNGEE